MTPTDAWLAPDRVLPVRLALGPDESFTSWMTRMSWHWRVSLRDLLKEGGVSDTDVEATLGLWGLELRDSAAQALAAAFELDPRDLQGRVLNHWNGTLFDLGREGNQLAADWAGRVNTAWVYTRASMLCPHCFSEDSDAFRLRWRMPWTFACLRHGVRLADTCSGCDRQPLSMRRYGRVRAAAPSQSRDPALCHNTIPPVAASDAHGTCWTPHREARAPELPADSPVLSAQRHLDSLLDGTQPVRLGQPVTLAAYFSSLKSLTTVIYTLAEVGDLEGHGPDEAAAFAAWVERRDASRGSSSPRRAPRATFVPHSTALLAAAIPAAVQVLAQPNRPEAVKAIAWLSHRLRTYFKFQHHVPALAKRLACTEDIAELLFDHNSPVWLPGAARASGLTGLPARKAPGPVLDSSAIPRCLPQALATQFSRFYDTRFVYKNRQCLSLALVHLQTGDWAEAATVLGIDPDVAARDSRLFVWRLERNGDTLAFGTQLEALSRHLADRWNATPAQDRVDWRQRERAFKDWVDFSDQQWNRLKAASGIRTLHAGRQEAPIGKSFAGPEARRGSRRRAAAWVWAELTGDRIDQAPALRTKTDDEMKLLNGFLKDVLPKMRHALPEVMAELKAERGCT